VVALMGVDGHPAPELRGLHAAQNNEASGYATNYRWL